MNAPEINELYDSSNCKKSDFCKTLENIIYRVDYVEDTRVHNAGSFTIYLEDHTIGNLIRTQLLENSEVIFAGYKKPHPLENKIEIKLRTSNSITPVESLHKALNGLITKVNKLSIDFEKELNEANKRKLFK